MEKKTKAIGRPETKSGPHASRVLIVIGLIVDNQCCSLGILAGGSILLLLFLSR